MGGVQKLRSFRNYGYAKIVGERKLQMDENYGWMEIMGGIEVTEIVEITDGWPEIKEGWKLLRDRSYTGMKISII